MDLRHLELIKEAVLIPELGIESTYMQNQKERPTWELLVRVQMVIIFVLPMQL